ncbi:hypothetical protein SB89_04295 [Corynebacterium glutamicum]|nr:hypothetical protein SB89_04295 [Corynebacterium glutamicum]
MKRNKPTFDVGFFFFLGLFELESSGKCFDLQICGKSGSNVHLNAHQQRGQEVTSWLRHTE